MWGLTTHLEIGVTPIISQKYHTNNGGRDVPGDLLLNAKLGSFGPLDGALSMALQLDARIPFGDHHNIPLQPYSADAIGFGGVGIVSLSRQTKTSSNFSWDVNIGYFNHNDADLKGSGSEADTSLSEAATQEIRAGAATRWSGKKIGLFAEVHGTFFLQQPPPTVYTRENYLYFSPGIVYQFNPWIQVMAGADILLQGLDDETTYEINGTPVLEKPWKTVPNMPDWRFTLGLSFRLREGTPPQPKEKKVKAPVEKVKETDKPEKASTETPKRPSKEEKIDKKQKENEIQELEKRLRTQEKEPVVESEEERFERLEAERQRMYEVLQELRSAMEEREKKEAQQREVERSKAEELRRQKEAEAAAAKQDSLLRFEATADSLAGALPDSTADALPPKEAALDSLTGELPAGEALPDSSTEVSPEARPDENNARPAEFQPEEQAVDRDSTTQPEDRPEQSDDQSQNQESVPDSLQTPGSTPEQHKEPPPDAPSPDNKSSEASDTPKDETETPEP